MSVLSRWDRTKRETTGLFSTTRRARNRSADTSHEKSWGSTSAQAPSTARLDHLIAAATVDAYGESEQRTGFMTMLEDSLKLPFETIVLGAPVVVERFDLNEAEEIVAICSRGRNRQALPILGLPLPTPPPPGAEWIEAYRRWARGR